MASKKKAPESTTIPTTAEAIREKLQTMLNAEMEKPEAGAQIDPRIIRKPEIEEPYATQAVEDCITGPLDDLTDRGRDVADEIIGLYMSFYNDGCGEVPEDAGELMMDLWEAEGGDAGQLNIPTAASLVNRYMSGELDHDALTEALRETVAHDVKKADDDLFTVLHSVELDMSGDYRAQIRYDMQCGTVGCYEHVGNSWTESDDPNVIFVTFPCGQHPEAYDVVCPSWTAAIREMVENGTIDGPEGYEAGSDFDDYIRDTSEGVEWAEEYMSEDTAILIALQEEMNHKIDPDADEDRVFELRRKAWTAHLVDEICDAVDDAIRIRE